MPMPLGGLGQRLLIKSVEVESVIDESSDSSLTHHQSVTSLIRHNLFFGFIYFLYLCVVDPKFVTQTEIRNPKSRNSKTVNGQLQQPEHKSGMDKSLPAADSIHQVPVQEVFDNNLADEWHSIVKDRLLQFEW